MNAKHKPRLPRINDVLTQQALDLHKRLKGDLEQLIQAERDKLIQVRHNSLGDICKTIGLFAYALGLPIAEVKHYFSEAVRAYQIAFQRRGTERAFHVDFISIESPRDQESPEALQRKPWALSDQPDFAPTNSRDNVLHVYLALAIGDYASATRFASMIWDPPRASYVGNDSLVCTTNEQHVAYAVRSLFAGEEQPAYDEIGSVSKRDNELNVWLQAQMVLAVVQNNASLFLSHLDALLDWHAKESERKQNRNNSNFYICLPGLGLAALAIYRHLVLYSHLPRNNIYLPLELCS